MESADRKFTEHCEQYNIGFIELFCVNSNLVPPPHPKASCYCSGDKWFGNEVYEVGGSVMLASGRPVPGDGVG